MDLAGPQNLCCVECFVLLNSSYTPCPASLLQDDLQQVAHGICEEIAALKV